MQTRSNSLLYQLEWSGGAGIAGRGGRVEGDPRGEELGEGFFFGVVVGEADAAVHGGGGHEGRVALLLDLGGDHGQMGNERELTKAFDTFNHAEERDVAPCASGEDEDFSSTSPATVFDDVVDMRDVVVVVDGQSFGEFDAQSPTGLGDLQSIFHGSKLSVACGI